MERIPCKNLLPHPFLQISSGSTPVPCRRPAATEQLRQGTGVSVPSCSPRPAPRVPLLWGQSSHRRRCVQRRDPFPRKGCRCCRQQAHAQQCCRLGSRLCRGYRLFKHPWFCGITPLLQPCQGDSPSAGCRATRRRGGVCSPTALRSVRRLYTSPRRPPRSPFPTTLLCVQLIPLSHPSDQKNRK